MEKEIRNLLPKDCEIRVAAEGRTVEGYAIVFNSESRDLGGFREVILPEAVEGVIENSDILALLNHNLDRGVLARSTNGQGSLRLKVDSKGMLYAFSAPKTTLGDEVVEGIQRGDIRTSSFAFTIAEDGEQWTKRGDEYLRTITKFEALYDVSAVYKEAYEDTSVALRSFDNIKENIPSDIVKAEPEPVIEEPIIEPTEEDNTESVEDFETRYLKQLDTYFRNT